MDSKVIRGVVVTKASETSVKHVTNAKVAVFNTNIEMQQGETKGTVLLKNADDLLNYTTGRRTSSKVLSRNLLRLVSLLSFVRVACRSSRSTSLKSITLWP